jgi:hypothetical protein
MLDLRLDHGALGRLLQVQQLRHDERLRVEETLKVRSQKPEVATGGGSDPSARCRFWRGCRSRESRA